MTTRSFHLDLPPSANSMFLNARGRGRIKTPKYRTWLTAMGYHLIEQKVLPLKGTIAVKIRAVRPDRRKRDLDNLAKPILDLMTIHGLIEDDSLVEFLSLEWIISEQPGTFIDIVALTKGETL